MITELFSMLSTIDVSGKGSNQKFSVNLNRNRIRSISAFSSNSIFYFRTIVSDQVTPEEMGMVSRVLEKSYAAFVVACIGLMPFHRIRADDQASIEEYLSQFHQNLGITPGNGDAVTKMLGLVSSLEESSTEPTNDDLRKTQDFLMECWEKSRANCTDFITVVLETVSLNEMYTADPVDPVTRVIQERYLANLEELDTWGFIGEATATMLDVDEDGLEDLSDEEIIARMMGPGSSEVDDDFDDDDLDEDEISDDELFDEGALQKLGMTMAKSPFGQFGMKTAQKAIKRKANKLNEGDEPISEGNVKSAIDSIMFSLESVSENKIKSCSSLSKLRSLEAKLNKLKNKYAKYLTRYKKKYKENKEKGTKGKLAIRFNGATITNPKAFMQQYGAYIKIINKRLKLVDKRREELRKRKGLPSSADDKKLEEAGLPVLTELDLQTVDYCIKTIDESLSAPDSEIFILTEAKGSKRNLQAEIDKLNIEIDDLRGQLGDSHADLYDAEQRVRNLAGSLTRQQGITQQTEKARREAEAKAKKLGDKSKKDKDKRKELQDKIKALEKQRDNLQRRAGGPGANDPRYWDSPGSAPPPGGRPPAPPEGLTYDKGRPVSGVNVGRAAIRNGYEGTKTFDREIFTNMDMKKSNEAVPTFAKATIGFIVDETEQVVNRDVLVGIKVYLHKVAAMELISDLYNCIINKRQFLKFVKWVSGEEKSLADLMFGFKELRVDALNSKGAGRWAPAFRRRKRWANMSVPYLMKGYTPNGTIVLTMNEVQFIKDEYGLDIMMPDHVKMLMDASFLLGFVVLDQANEMCYITYDGHGGEFQQYTYAMLEREQQSSDRMLRELYRSISR
ncbi:MAG: hypothetical protein NC114_10735 [Ruminococcus flavefaciens]|nr:hypothetical protein [Ruminococcus flavefaciens]